MQKIIFINVLMAIFILAGCVSNQPINETQNAPINPAENSPESSENNNQNLVDDDEYDLAGSIFHILLVGSEDPPFGDEFHSIQSGVEDAIEYFNHQGGVFGADLNLEVENVQLEGDNLDELVVSSLVGSDAHIAFLAIPVSEELYKKLNGQSVPVLYFGLGGVRVEHATAGRDNLFWLTPMPDEQMAFMFESLRENWEEITPAPEIPEMIGAYFTWEGDFGNRAYTKELESYFSHRAFNLIGTNEFELSPNSNVSNALIAGLTNNVGLIYTDTFAFGPAVIANDLLSLGMQDFFVLAGSTWCCDSMENYLYAPPFNGSMYVLRSTAWWPEDSNPGIVRAKEIASFGNRSEGELDFGYLLGVSAVDIAEEVFARTVLEEQKGDIKASNVYTQISNLADYQVLDGLFEIDYSDRNRFPDLMQLWQYDSQKGWQALTDMELIPNLE